MRGMIFRLYLRTTFGLFIEGRTVPIYVKKTGAGFSYIEFFGRRNDGKIDSIMYRDPNSGLSQERPAAKQGNEPVFR